MAKPTSLATQVNRMDLELRTTAEKEDLEIAKRDAPSGKIWVRLIRPHYDAENVFHPAGPALLNINAIPSTAKRLTVAVEAVED